MEIKLSNKEVAVFEDDNSGLSILLDTGAFISVFTEKKELLFKLFKDVHYSGYDAFISGFGGKGQFQPVFIIDCFIINNIRFHNFPIAVNESKLFESELILSSYVFKNVPFLIDYSNRVLRLNEIPNNEIWCRYSVRKYNGKEIINKFYVFTENEL